MRFLHWLFGSGDFMAHGYCFMWNRGLLTLHLFSDLGTGLAYVAIAVMIAYLVHRARRDIPFHWMFLAFGVFIVACGATHLMEVWTLFTPVYWLSGCIKAVTAVASIATAAALPPLVPRTLTLIRDAKAAEKQRMELARVNELLRLEIGEREKVEAEVRRLNEQLEARVKERTAQLSRMSAIVESTDDAIIGKTLEGVITDWNAGATRLYGYSAAEMIGQHISVLIPEGHPDEIPEILHRISQGERFDHFDTVRKHKDGAPVAVSLKISPILDDSGTIVGASTIAHDITERKQAEQEIRLLNATLEDRVRQRTAELEAANQELEAFAYSVSHDLRAPLRGIDGWSLALVEDYAGQLDQNAREYLGLVRSETQRMGMLIDDLLKLSRATRVKMEIGTVDLTSIARTIAARLDETNLERRIDFTIPDGLEVSGDAQLLEIALTNLFSNAVKFTGRQAEARIEFGRTERDGKRPLFVRDNGVGFDMAFAGQLFGAFQRLHTADEFPGTGVGLATVQRIIHRHGGRIWAEAEPGRGATFYFTLEVTNESQDNSSRGR